MQGFEPKIYTVDEIRNMDDVNTVYIQPRIYEQAVAAGQQELLEANKIRPMLLMPDTNTLESIKEKYLSVGLVVSDEQAVQLLKYFEELVSSLGETAQAIVSLNEVISPPVKKPAWAKFNEAPKRRKR